MPTGITQTPTVEDPMSTANTDNFDADEVLAEMLAAVVNPKPSLPEPLAARHVTDLGQTFVVVRMLADVLKRTKHCQRHAPSDDAARQDLVDSYLTLRNAAVTLVGDDYAHAAEHWGLPSCAPSATLAQVGNAAELASTFLNSLMEVPSWLTAKQFEAASAKLLTSSMSDDAPDTAGDPTEPLTQPTGQYL
jgi:hypothetical protein